jgi:hypothetical protein
MRSANYVEETTTSIAGTGGNGAVTLTAIASIPRFSTVFGTQATTIRYVIEDTVGKKMETGIGSVASNVLTRTRPQVTWDGTTYADSTPSPIAFGSAPTSGNIRVRLAATAESQGSVNPGMNITVGSGPFQEFAVSRSLKTNTNGLGGSLVANVEYYWCYRLDHAGLLNGFAFDVMTSAGTGIKAALYALGANGLPSQKIVDFNTLSTASTGFKSDTATSTWAPNGPVWLNPGWYAVGGISDGAPAIRGASGAFGLFSGTPFSRPNDGYGDANLISIPSKSYTTGLPAAPTWTGAVLRGDSSAITGVWMCLRVIA